MKLQRDKNMTQFVQKILVDSDRRKFTMTQNAQKRCWHCDIWPDWFYFPPITLLLILRWHTGVYDQMVYGKIAQTMQNIWNFIPESLVYKKWQTSAIIWAILDSNRAMPGDREIWSKICSLPDYPGELTALSTVATASQKAVVNTSTHNFPLSSCRWKVLHFL